MSSSVLWRRIALFAVLSIVVISFLSATSFHRSFLPFSSKKPRAAIVMLLSPYRLTQAATTILNVEDRFNRRLKYPYVLFMTQDDLAIVPDDFKAKINQITERRATIGTFTFCLFLSLHD
jgi:hypothetical protein